ncbi:MAG: DUF1538 domain-containing protein [Clostridia bacterium]|nr:DUF1538 domain-containing protein [Clostridia bacterium]
MGKGFLIKKDATVVSAKIKEAVSSVLPVCIIVFVLGATVTPIDSGVMLAFLFGAFLMSVGMGLFSLGADVAMTPIGEYVGMTVLKTKKLWIILPIFFIVGLLITIAEPDLLFLTDELEESVDKWLILVTVGVGVGVFLCVAFLKMVLRVKISVILLLGYLAVFALSFFVPKNFMPLAFDSGGVTTGPISVPFIIAIGTGIASIRDDRNAESEGFGLTALCSIGPVISVMILGIVYKPYLNETAQAVVGIPDSREIMYRFGLEFPVTLKEIGIALTPIAFLFLISYAFGDKVGEGFTIRTLLGILYAYCGLVAFLVGAKVGFGNMGYGIGKTIGELEYNGIVVPISMLIGFFIIAAEPAVHVLTKRVSDVSGGAISGKALALSLMLGMSAAVGISFLRTLLHIRIIYFLLPAYVIAVSLAFVVPEFFTAIAFDAGGVSSGSMTTCFLLPLALGFCNSVGGDFATEGLGLIALVAVMPVLTLQVVGLIVKIKSKNVAATELTGTPERERILD